MFNQSPFSSTHPLLKRILVISISVTLIAIFFNAFLTQTLGLPSIASLIAITPWGAKHGAVYQIITYPFISSIVFAPLSLWSLLGAFFQYYIVLSIGSTFIYQRGAKRFAFFFFGCTLLTGAVGFLLLALTNSTPALLAGFTYPITAMLIFFAFHNPEAQILIFFFPVRAKWAVFGLTAIYLFLDFSNGQFIHFFCTLTTFIYAYCYCVLSSEQLGPFTQLHSLDRGLIRAKYRVLKLLPKRAVNSPSKIQNLYTTKKQIQKDLYLDLILEKIAKHGKSSLSWKERWFLMRYSK